MGTMRRVRKIVRRDRADYYEGDPRTVSGIKRCGPVEHTQDSSGEAITVVNDDGLEAGQLVTPDGRNVLEVVSDTPYGTEVRMWGVKDDGGD